jgi:hypothetical protein
MNADVLTAERKPAARKRARTPRVEDRTTDYARQVIAGQVIAGPHVRDACARHLRGDACHTASDGDRNGCWPWPIASSKAPT